MYSKQIVKALPLRLVIVLLTCSWVTPLGTQPPSRSASDSTATILGGGATATARSPTPSSASGGGGSETRPTTNVSVTNGSIVDLSCSVATESPATIVWLQGDGSKVLFYGSNRATDDKRLSVRILVEEGAIRSTLRIEPVRQEDQGKFICRVPRKDHIHTEVIQLSVKVSTTPPSAQAASSLLTQGNAQAGNDTVLTVTSR